MIFAKENNFQALQADKSGNLPDYEMMDTTADRVNKFDCNIKRRVV